MRKELPVSPASIRSSKGIPEWKSVADSEGKPRCLCPGAVRTSLKEHRNAVSRSGVAVMGKGGRHNYIL